MDTVLIINRETGEHIVCRADQLATAPAALYPPRAHTELLANALGELQRAYLSGDPLDGIQWFLGISVATLSTGKAVA